MCCKRPFSESIVNYYLWILVSPSVTLSRPCSWWGTLGVRLKCTIITVPHMDNTIFHNRIDIFKHDRLHLNHSDPSLLSMNIELTLQSCTLHMKVSEWVDILSSLFTVCPEKWINTLFYSSKILPRSVSHHVVHLDDLAICHITYWIYCTVIYIRSLHLFHYPFS